MRGRNSILTQLVMNSSVPLTISDGERELLARLLEDDAEQLTRAEPGGWWLGSDQVSAKVCFRLLRHALIQQDGGNFDDEIIYYRVHADVARKVLSDPGYVPPMIRAAKGEPGPFIE